MHRNRSLLTVVLWMLLLFLLGCSEDRKDDYKGVSELIADRSRARSGIKSSPSDENKSPATGQDLHQEKKTGSADEEISPVILYEENVKIYSESSDKLLAKGVAYINKQGQIVRLKIVNE